MTSKRTLYIGYLYPSPRKSKSFVLALKSPSKNAYIEGSLTLFYFECGWRFNKLPAAFLSNWLASSI